LQAVESKSSFLKWIHRPSKVDNEELVQEDKRTTKKKKKKTHTFWNYRDELDDTKSLSNREN
jgi:hypothetical protein